MLGLLNYEYHYLINLHYSEGLQYVCMYVCN